MMSEPMTRPNGKAYRPRVPGELRTVAWENEFDRGVIVFGTLDVNEARDTAILWCRYWYGTDSAKCLRPGWFRDSFWRGERTWIGDDAKGRPGVMFEAVDE